MRGFRACLAVVILLPLAQTTFAQWETIDSAQTAGPTVKKMSPYRERMYREKAEFGNTLYIAGSITSWTGLAAFWGGGFLGQGNLTSLGFLALAGGIPVMGAGAGKIHYAAIGMNPEARDVGADGWVLWGAGLVATYATFIFVAANVESDEGTLSSAEAYTAFGLFTGGQLLFYAGWFEFSRRRAMANSNFTSISVRPTLHFAAQKVDGVGVQGYVGF